MEALSLLRYWRSNGGDATTINANVTTSTATGHTTTIVTGVNSHESQTGDEKYDDDDEDNDIGPFFDLQFSLPAEGDGAGEVEDDEDEDCDGSDESELKFTLMSDSTSSTSDVNVSASPSDDLFFKGGFVPVDHTAELDSKPPQFRLSLMKSATKFRVMMLKLRKSKLNAESTESSASNASSCTNSNEEQKKEKKTDRNGESTDSGKSMTVKLKVEEAPLVGLFKRHNSSKASKKRQNENEPVSGSSEQKKFTKEAMEKYLRKVKPLYIRVSQKYGEKLKLAGNLTKPNISPSSSTTEEQKDSSSTNPRREKQSTAEVAEPPLLASNTKGLKQGNLPAGLRVVCKHFGKSWSASTVTTAAAAVISGVPGATPSNRRDDSLLQQQDGIQSAILHCKRSFKASRDSESSTSDPAPAAGKCENG